MIGTHPRNRHPIIRDTSGVNLHFAVLCQKHLEKAAKRKPMNTAKLNKALRVQAHYTASFDSRDVPKRCVNMGFMCFCIGHFGAVDLALWLAGSVLALEVLAYALRHVLPEDEEDIPSALVWLVFLRVFLAINVFTIASVALFFQPSQAAVVVGLIILSGVAIHSISAHTLLPFMNWMVVPSLSFAMGIGGYLVLTRDYRPPNPGDGTLIALTCLLWVIALVMTVMRQHGTRKAYNEALGSAKVRAERLKFLSRHDALTGLLNRPAFDELLLDAIQFISPRDHIAVCVIDLDKFKPINDTFGHAAGDAALVEMANRIRAIAGVDKAARLGGDEFALIWTGANDRQKIQATAQALKHSLCEPMTYKGQQIQLGASIGVTFGTSPDDDPAALCARADQAMYTAKSESSAQPCFFDDLREAG